MKFATNGITTMPDIKGILDKTTQEVLVLGDDRSIIRGNLKVHGVLEAGLIKTVELIADQRYEKKFLTFVTPEGSELSGTGFLWHDKIQNKQLVFRTNPDCFFLSEHINLANGKAFLIDNNPILTREELGSTVIKSNLTEIGKLKKLEVAGTVNFGNSVFFNPVTQRFSINKDDPSNLFSVYDPVNDVEIVLDGSENGHGKIGTLNNRNLELISGNQTRVTLHFNGNITLGHEYKNNTNINLYGKVGVNVKNPKESLEIDGNLKFQNKLFTSGTSAPLEGTYHKGDIVWNTDPGPSKYIGWVCITSGSPGHWAPFGLIAG
jgi:hypothetical protein